ncbi:MAG: 7-carboxy-7-deazaguanine synthase [Firmicutes bacterium]|nr:7-carboxy-7-deazaguanine synthase [Bacillota bacterium]MDI6705832.1 radical SAM protein [Bacillota bacterium]
MKVNEIFLSIQGEGLLTGFPTVFVRFTGCNLRCSFCDTTYSYYSGEEMSAEQIYQRISDYGFSRVCLTGGEPLLQEGLQELIDRLEGYRVTIETNGSIPLDRVSLLEGQTYVMDVKAPSSGEEGSIHWPNFELLREEDEVKFVVGNREDYLWARDIIQKELVKGTATISPVFGKIIPAQIVRWILEDGLDVRFQLQLHKIIFDPDARGV